MQKKIKEVRWHLITKRFYFQIILVAIVFHIEVLRGQTYEQITTPVTINHSSIIASALLEELKTKTAYSFSYAPEELAKIKFSNIQGKNRPLGDLLQELTHYGLRFDCRGMMISVAYQKPVNTLQQPRMLSGAVTDEHGNPLAGATISIKETSTVANTDTNGNFKLMVKPGAYTIVVSFMGYQTLEVPIGSSNTQNIQLLAENESLVDVVVVGYGTQRKQTLTGAISNIKSKEIQTTTNSSLAQLLQGKIAGLQIRQNSQEPGEFNTDINIRGFGTPLFVIDGIARDGSNVFQRLNPEDIEDITVLKDASAAIYGLRAANGVIIVTTKKGQVGKPTIRYSIEAGLQAPTDIVKMADAATYMELRNEAALLATGTPFLSEEELEKYRQGVPGYESTDWTSLVLKKQAPQYIHDLSFSGGNEQTRYFVNFGALDEEGLLKSGDMKYKRYTLRSNITTAVAKNLTAEILLYGKFDKKEAPGENFFNIFRGTRQTLPTESAYANNNPDYLGYVTSGFNPLAAMDKDISGYQNDLYRDFQSSISLTYDIPFIKGLSAKGVFAYDARNYQGKQLYKSYPLYTYNAETGTYSKTIMREGASYLTNSNTNFDRETWQAQLNYKTQIQNDHNISASLIFEEQKWNQRASTIKRYYGDYFTGDQLDFTETANQETSGSEDETASLSYIGRFNYNYKGKYLVEFAFREDGSYRYAPGSRWGFFPVGSIGWKISDEPFFKNNLHFFDNLKFRASYGRVGEDAGSPFQYLPGFSLTGGGGYEFTDGEYTKGVATPAIVNKDLTWFTSNILDIGVDASLWKGRLDLVFDIYQRDRSGLLAYRNASLPNTFGGTLPQENLNSDRVRGLDFTVSHTQHLGAFSYGINFNFNYARTMSKYVEQGDFTNGKSEWRNGTAYRWNDVIWGYVSDGQFQSTEEIAHSPVQSGSLGNTSELPGDYKYKDVNGDGIIDGNDMVPLFYNGTPKLHAGLGLQASYKGFDVNILFQSAAKYTVRFEGTYAQPFSFSGNLPAYFTDRWHLEDPYDLNSGWVPGKWPSMREAFNMGSLAYAESSARRYDASYIRLKSAEIGYTFHSSWIQHLKISNLRVYANGHDLLTFTNAFVKPFDPEKAEGANNMGYTYPLIRSFNLGLSITF